MKYILFSLILFIGCIKEDSQTLTIIQEEITQDSIFLIPEAESGETTNEYFILFGQDCR